MSLKPPTKPAKKPVKKAIHAIAEKTSSATKKPALKKPIKSAGVAAVKKAVSRKEFSALEGSDEPDGSVNKLDEIENLDEEEQLLIEQFAPQELTESDGDGVDKKRKKKPTLEEVLDVTQLYLKEIGYSVLLSAGEEKELTRLAQKGDEKARHRMIESNLRLVVKIAKSYFNRGLPFLDIIAEGNIGLMHAVSKFDPERGFRFSTYSTWWIRQSIERALMNQVRTIRLPVHVIKEMNIYLRAARQLSQALDHKPTYEEIAELVDKPIEDVKTLLACKQDVTSYDVSTNAEGYNNLSDIIPDTYEQGDPVKNLQNKLLSAHLKELLEGLDGTQAEVVMRRFGLGNYHEKQTLRDVGKAVGLTRERVRQIQLEGLKLLRQRMVERGLTSAVFFED